MVSHEESRQDSEAGSGSVSASKFEPKVLGFLCNWCSYAGADLAGVSRFQYPPNLRVIRVMCSGRIDPYIILEAFIAGADGVLIGGCHPGDCHYLEGNYNALNKINMAHHLLEHAGFDSERLQLEWVSASEGDRFAQVVTDFTNKIRSLGPSELSVNVKEKNAKLVSNLSGAERAALGFRLRALVGREYNLLQKGNVYGEQVDEDELEAKINFAIETEYIRGVILELTSKRPQSVHDLAKVLERPTKEILRHIVALRGSNLVAQSGEDGRTPLFTALTTG